MNKNNRPYVGNRPYIRPHSTKFINLTYFLQRINIHFHNKPYLFLREGHLDFHSQNMQSIIKSSVFKDLKETYEVEISRLSFWKFSYVSKPYSGPKLAKKINHTYLIRDKQRTNFSKINNNMLYVSTIRDRRVVLSS